MKIVSRLGLISAWQRWFSKYALNGKRLGNVPRNGKMIFQLVGLPRSGTTLLASIIDNHPDAVCLIEPYHSWVMTGKFDINFPFGDEILPNFQAHNPDRLIKYLCKNAPIQVVGFKETYRSHRHSFPSASFLMKNNRFGYVDDTVVIVRDPRDSWVSALTRSKNSRLGFSDLEEYLYALDGLFNWIVEDQLFVIRYEDVVLQPVRVKNVMEKLGLNFQDSFLELRPKGGYGDIRAQSGGSIFTSSVGRYKEFLKSDLIGYIENNSMEYLTYFGYSS